MKESRVEAYLKERAEAHGALVRKLAYLGRKGASDRMVVWGHANYDRLAMTTSARIDFVELKAPGKKPDHHQEREHARLRALGCNVFVLDSIEAVDAYIASRT